jgi:hypothetical protein
MILSRSATVTFWYEQSCPGWVSEHERGKRWKGVGNTWKGFQHLSTEQTLDCANKRSSPCAVYTKHPWHCCTLPSLRNKNSNSPHCQVVACALRYGGSFGSHFLCPLGCAHNCRYVPISSPWVFDLYVCFITIFHNHTFDTNVNISPTKRTSKHS